MYDIVNVWPTNFWNTLFKKLHFEPFFNIVLWILLQKVCEFEEKESKSRNIVVDSEIFFDVVREAQSNLDQVKDAKLAQKKVNFKLLTIKLYIFVTEKLLQNSPANVDVLNDKLMQFVVKICVIKKLNRLDKLEQVSEREALNVEKQKCDSTKLIYQNLVYELYHLVTETNKCLAFK